VARQEDAGAANSGCPNPVLSAAMAKIDSAEFDRHYLELTYHVGLFMVAYLRRLQAEFKGDLTMAIVLGEIAQRSASRFMREVLPKSGMDAKTLATDEVIAENLRRCNMLSVAEASGVPRETVRRKVDKLVALGLVSRADDGTLAVTRKVGTHFKAFDRQAMQELLELAERVRAVVGRR
jgi:hypothetical protein